MVLLTAENIRKSYGTRVIFDDISFSIHEGDKIGVVGVNGTGKSTLLKIVAGVNQADSGEIITMNGMRMGPSLRCSVRAPLCWNRYFMGIIR